VSALQAGRAVGQPARAAAERHGGVAGALGIEVDVRDHAAVEAMVARVVQEWSRVDVLVANAGGGRGRPIDTCSAAISMRPATVRMGIRHRGNGMIVAA